LNPQTIYRSRYISTYNSVSRHFSQNKRNWKITMTFKSIFSIIDQLIGSFKPGVPAPPASPDISFDVALAPTDLDVPQFPERPDGAMTGSEFANHIMTMGPFQAREDAICNEILSGNIPDFMRYFLPISVSIGANTIKYLVSPDLLSVGSNSDYIRVPLNPLTAQKIAATCGCTLPTSKIARQIWTAAEIKLAPNPNGPPYDTYMQSVDAFVKSNTKINNALVGQPLGKLVSGHKKDIVICKQLLNDPSRVAIYGWFQLNGVPIQGLNPRDHGKGYKDYSHGVRLVSRHVLINGAPYDLFDVLNNSSLCSLISDDSAYDASTIYSR